MKIRIFVVFTDLPFKNGTAHTKISIFKNLRGPSARWSLVDVGRGGVHAVCMRCACGVHVVCMWCACGVHGVCMGCAWGVYRVCKVYERLYARGMCLVCMQYTRGMHVVLGVV